MQKVWVNHKCFRYSYDTQMNIKSCDWKHCHPCAPVVEKKLSNIDQQTCHFVKSESKPQITDRTTLLDCIGSGSFSVSRIQNFIEWLMLIFVQFGCKESSLTLVISLSLWMRSRLYQMFVVLLKRTKEQSKHLDLSWANSEHQKKLRNEIMKATNNE